LRSDTKRNRRQLIQAAGRLFATSTGLASVSMSDIAREAEISPATAYRHFASVEEVLIAYRYGIGERLKEFSDEQKSSGVTLLRDVDRRWVELVGEHGWSMVHTRSPEGYLARLRSGAEYLTVQADALERPLREAIEELGLPAIGDEAMFLWNILFDPREILDVINTIGLSEKKAADRLTDTFLGAVGGWCGDRRAPRG
jgi:AcrR family transcriptional regulator